VCIDQSRISPPEGHEPHRVRPRSLLLSIFRQDFQASPERGTCVSSRAPAAVGGAPDRVSEFGVAEWVAAGTLAAAEANEHSLTTAETRRLQIGAHWADLHPGDRVVQSRLPGTERPVRLGGDGTPTVGDFAPAELGCVLRISEGSACRLIGDALDLRHRLRLVWAGALAGQVPAYQARWIAAATHHLSADQAAYVDARIAPSLGGAALGAAADPARGNHLPSRPSRC